MNTIYNLYISAQVAFFRKSRYIIAIEMSQLLYVVGQILTYFRMTHNKIVYSLVRQLRSRFPPNPQNKVVHISILLIFSSYFFIVSVSSSVQRSEMDID